MAPLRVRGSRELSPVLPARLARGANVTPPDGLRDDPAPGERRGIPALLDARDVTRRVGGRSALDARLLSLAPARRAGRVSISRRHRAIAPPAPIRRAPAHPRAGSEAPARRAGRGPRGAGPGRARLSGAGERIEGLTIATRSASRSQTPPRPPGLPPPPSARTCGTVSCR